MDSPQAPAAPDPVATAAAQGTANVEAARVTAGLNRPDQITPYGSQTWTQNGDKWTSTTTLDPRAQAVLDAQLKTSQGLTGSIDSALQRTTDTLANPIDYAGAPAAGNYGQASTNAAGRFTDVSPALQAQQGIAANASGLANGQTDRLKALYGTDFNYDGVTAPTPEANEAVRNRVTDAYYANETSRLDPKFAQDEDRMRTDLMNRGLTEGSKAWNDQRDLFQRGKNDAYSLASNNAQTKGGDAMQQLFGMELAARQQGTSEADKMRQMPTAEAAAAAALAGGANSTAGSMYGTELAQSGAQDAAALNQSGAQSSERAANLAEQERKRAQVLNELASLRTGAQVQSPQFQSGASGANVAAAPVAQSAYNSYQGQMNAYNADVASGNSTMGALGSIGAGFAGSGAGSALLAAF